MKCSAMLKQPFSRAAASAGSMMRAAPLPATAYSSVCRPRRACFPAALVGCQSHHFTALSAARRCASTESGESGKPKIVHYSKLGMDGFTDVKYNTAADQFLEHLEAKLDSLETEELEDVNCSGGVLTIETSSKGTFILNKQAPNVQLWLSSPISGPHHYDMVTSTQNGVEKVLWQSDNDSHDLVEKLEMELSDVLYTPFQV